MAFKTILLCGSESQKEKYDYLTKAFEDEGNFVLRYGVNNYKIDICDELYVITNNDTISKEVENFIEYAYSKNKSVVYNSPTFCLNSDTLN